MNKSIFLPLPGMSYFQGFILATLAGTAWSFGTVIVRKMIHAEDYAFSYLFYRGALISIVVLLYMFFRDGRAFVRNFAKIGKSGFVGALCLSAAMIAFIFSITRTSVAVTMFMLAAIPFLTSLLSYLLLKERIGKNTVISMSIAALGICVMAMEEFRGGSYMGGIFGLTAAISFALFSVSLRRRPETPKFATMALGGMFCSAFSFIFAGGTWASLAMPQINIYLSSLHGLIIGLGLILFSMGARALPAAELTFLVLIEAVGGVIWVALPIFGINELPTPEILLGGLLILIAVVLHGYNIKLREKRLRKIF